MKLDNYKTIKKSEWQEIATTLNVEYAKEDVVRILLEKIAIKLALNFRNVSDNDLKKEVAEKVNEDFEVILVEEFHTLIKHRMELVLLFLKQQYYPQLLQVQFLLVVKLQLMLLMRH